MTSIFRPLTASRALALILFGTVSPAFAQVDGEAPAPAQPPEKSGEGTASEGDDAGDRDDGADAAEAEDTANSQPPTPEVDPYAEAKERVGRAEQLYEDGNYDAALTEFEQAYGAMLGHPARGYVLFNIGKCQEKLYRYDAAIRSYRTYLSTAGENADDKDTVEAKIELLEGLLGTLEIKVTAKGGGTLAAYEVWVDGRLIDEAAHKKFMIPGGNHQVEVRADGFEVQNQEVQVPARSEKSLDFALSPLAAEYKGLPEIYFWSAAGLAAATGVAGGAFGVMAITKRSSVDQKLPEQRSQADKDAIVQRAMVADIFFAGAGVFATTAVILAFMTDWSGDSEEKSPVQIKEVGFAPTRSGGFIGVRGAF